MEGRVLGCAGGWILVPSGSGGQSWELLVGLEGTWGESGPTSSPLAVVVRSCSCWEVGCADSFSVIFSKPATEVGSRERQSSAKETAVIIIIRAITNTQSECLSCLYFSSISCSCFNYFSQAFMSPSYLWRDWLIEVYIWSWCLNYEEKVLLNGDKHL